MTGPLTPNQVVAQLAELARDLDVTVRHLQDAEVVAVDARHAVTLAEAKAFLAAEGSVETRKRLAFVCCEQMAYEAEVAEAAVRHLRRRIAAVGVRIDVGRSYSSAIKAEMAFATQGGQP